jgi:hypothetical protein
MSGVRIFLSNPASRRIAALLGIGGVVTLGLRLFSRMGRAILLAVGITTLACGGTNEPTQPPPPAAPTLLTPANDAVIVQNDAPGCPFDARYGAGLQIPFDWTDVTPAAGLAGYEIQLQSERASLPALDTTVQVSEHLHLRCNSYVSDSFLDGWVWKVRAVDRSGQFGPWAERRFSYAPCRIGPRPCSP